MISPVKGSTDGLVFLRLGVLVGLSGCSSPSSKLDFMWYFLAGVFGDVELALDSLGEDVIDDTIEEPSEKTESVLDPPPGGFNTLLKFLASALSGIISWLMWLIPPGGCIRVVLLPTVPVSSNPTVNWREVAIVLCVCVATSDYFQERLCLCRCCWRC